MIFVLTLTVKDISIARILSEKKYRGAWLISEKKDVLYAELNERPEAASSTYCATGDFYSIFILCL